MIVHTSENYPYFGLCILPHMCPNLIEQMVPYHFRFFLGTSTDRHL